MNSLHVARFTVAYWCVFVAVLLPLVCAWLAKSGGFGKPRREGGYDNHDPRAWMARQTDWHARANAAQANSFEALPFFIGAVTIAHQLHAAHRLIADVVCGGEVDAGTLVTEEYLMALERKHFCALLEHPKSQERIMGMLQTGKPVRN